MAQGQLRRNSHETISLGSPAFLHLLGNEFKQFKFKFRHLKQELFFSFNFPKTTPCALAALQEGRLKLWLFLLAVYVLPS